MNNSKQTRTSPKTNAIVYSGSGILDDGNGNDIDLDSREFKEWIQNPENSSFRFEAGDNSYRARREIYSGNTYWYAVKKVAGHVVRRSIAREDEVDYASLVRVAETIRTPIREKVVQSTIPELAKQPEGISEMHEAIEKAVDPLIKRMITMEARLEELAGKLAA